MIGLILSIIIFNVAALIINKKLNRLQVMNIWMFTVSFQTIVDVYLDIKYHGYWYFTMAIDWISLPVITVLLPPLNIIFLNWYPERGGFIKKIKYFSYWLIFMVSYELFALLPEPWGYFNYGWWKLWYSILVDPFLLLAVLGYHRWTNKKGA